MTSHRINPGRVNNAFAALVDWWRRMHGQDPSRVEQAVLRTLAEQALIADDRYLVSRTNVAESRLRVHLGKAQDKIAVLGRQIDTLNRRITASKDRDEDAAERMEAAKLLERQAEGWRLAAEGYLKQANILRKQLADAGIEPDRRAS